MRTFKVYSCRDNKFKTIFFHWRLLAVDEEGDQEFLDEGWVKKYLQLNNRSTDHLWDFKWLSSAECSVSIWTINRRNVEWIAWSLIVWCLADFMAPLLYLRNKLTMYHWVCLKTTHIWAATKYTKLIFRAPYSSVEDSGFIWHNLLGWNSPHTSPSVKAYSSSIQQTMKSSETHFLVKNFSIIPGSTCEPNI